MSAWRYTGEHDQERLAQDQPPHLKLAKQLIESSTSNFDLDAYKDDYEAAVVKLVNEAQGQAPARAGTRASPRQGG